MSYSISSVASFMKSQKERELAKDSDDADLGPHIIVEKDGNPAAIFIAPKTTDKIQACKAAMMCKIGFDPDSITLGFDAIISSFGDQKVEKECIVLQKIDKENKIEMATMPYEVYGDKLVWDEDLQQELDNPIGIFGDITDKLMAIMNISTDHVSVEEVLNGVLSKEEISEFSRDKFVFYTSRAAMGYLMGMGFKIIDLISYKHPEWTDAKENGEKILDKMVEAEIISEEQKKKLFDIVKNHVGTIVFKERFEHELTVAKCKLPKKMKIFTFVSIFEQMCIQPKANESFIDSLKVKSDSDDDYDDYDDDYDDE